MARVFLSHAATDKPVARRIADALRGAGHQPWLDEDILVGESIPVAIESALREADFVVICSASPGEAPQSSRRRTRILVGAFVPVLTGIAMLSWIVLMSEHRNGHPPARADDDVEGGWPETFHPVGAKPPSAPSEPEWGGPGAAAAADPTWDAGAASNDDVASTSVDDGGAGAGSTLAAMLVREGDCFVELSSTPAGADIVIDQTRVIGTTPRRVALPCGHPIDLTIRKAGFFTATREVTPTRVGLRLSVALVKAGVLERRQ